jgi:hypothetical protein
VRAALAVLTELQALRVFRGRPRLSGKQERRPVTALPDGEPNE